MRFQRFLEGRVEHSLKKWRVVAVNGPRQSGKTTLAGRFTSDKRPFHTLDDPAAFQLAVSDPIGFIKGNEYAIIDEVQRAPDLIRAIKMSVDSDSRRGQFLLTGSANIRTIPTISESLAGRMKVQTLLPLAQAEIEGVQASFLDDLFDEKDEPFRRSVYKMDGLERRVLKGGYPEMQDRESEDSRQGWAIEYLDGVLYRDFREILAPRGLRGLFDLAQASAIQTGQLVVHAKVAKRLKIDPKTARDYMYTLEQMYLLRYLEPWGRNDLRQMIRTPKLHFLDTGLCSAIRQISLSLLKRGRTVLGPLLESFALAELLKLASWSDRRLHFHHYRDLRQNKVDFVISNGDHSVVGIEVKASTSVRPDDFSGLRCLQRAAGSLFKRGVLLYAGEQVARHGDRLYAAPVSVLWS